MTTPPSPPDEQADAAHDEPQDAAKPTVARNGKQIVEALIFAADQPVAAARLSQFMGKRIDARAVRAFIDELNADYAAQGFFARHAVFFAGGVAAGIEYQSDAGRLLRRVDAWRRFDQITRIADPDRQIITLRFFFRSSKARPADDRQDDQQQTYTPASEKSQLRTLHARESVERGSRRGYSPFR